MIRPRSRARTTGAGDGLPWRIGVPIIMLMVVGIVTSVWFVWRIDKDLGELARNRQEFIAETEINRELTARRDSLLAPESIVRKAAVLGLFPPTDEQIRKP
ncbi:MAG: hypothetical protein RQ753_05855 [Desulfurivibrionaceae bacterium]|nr:hypothetical protein [Desulfobulbales bacterium]MDT8335199.1 hypothetical protein [Desulfurivibrionaceae bacterium]